MTPFGIRKRVKKILGLQKPPRPEAPKRPKYKVLFVLPDGNSYDAEAKEGDSLVLTSNRGAYPISQGCSDGTCGTCRVEVLEGHGALSQADGHEEETKNTMGMRDTEWYLNRYVQETGELVIQSMKDLFSVDNLWSALGIPVFHWTWEGDFTTDYGTKKIFRVVNSHKDLARDLQHDGPLIHQDAFEQIKDKVKCLI